MKIIDAHAHLGFFGGWANVGVGVKEALSQMDEFNIEKSIISAPVNEEVRKACKQYPNRFVGTVWVNPYDGEKAVQEVYEYA